MRKILFAALALIMCPVLSYAAEPLVDVAWVTVNLDNPQVRLVDLRGPRAHAQAHIPGAVATDYGRDGWRVKNKDGVAGMLPEDTSRLAALIGKLGIGNGSHVVLVPPGYSSSDMGIATRLFWTFKVLGHDVVSILDGGMAAYAADKRNRLEKGPVQVTPQTFTVSLRRDMLVDAAGVEAAREAGTTLVDNRPADQHLGLVRHPDAKRAGTIAGARSLPQSWVTQNGGGTFRTPDELKKLYSYAGVAESGPQINFCNTGHWASLGWFVSSQLLGNDQARLYDGSMVDWSRHGDLPVERKVPLN
jgi:thiosulfate/3-mercaptopyruvate sulfurtransferase